MDAIGVTKSLKTVTRPTVPFKDLAMEVVMGETDADTASSLAGRLARYASLRPEEAFTLN